ncbi:hypothetical protein BE11_18170 [Sorangium cellulosum]|nr:hypothetical protein BE11_18170 [Sorangium cellulosum]
MIDGKGTYLGKMSAGKSKLLVGIVAPYTTNKDAILIELFDEDMIGERDSLGSAFLPFHHSNVDREQVLKLEGSGSAYELTCFVDI